MDNVILQHFPNLKEHPEESLAVHRLAVALNVELERLGLSTHWEDLTPTQQTRLRERATVALRLDHPDHSIAAKVRARIKLGQARETCEREGFTAPLRYQAETTVTAFLDGLLGRYPAESEDQ